MEAWTGARFHFDLFASESNTKCRNYATKFPTTLNASANAFSLSWNLLGLTFACPPPSLAVPALRQYAKQKVSGVLMLPLWQSANYWPLICPDGLHLARFVVRFLIMTPSLKVGKDVISKTFRRKMPFIIMLIDGNVNKCWERSALCPKRK